MTTPSLAPSTLLSTLNWRYATKAFDSTKAVAPETWKALEDTLVLTPSSFGLQPWKFLIVTNPEVRASLLPHSWGQKQVTDCSHYVVFASIKKVSETDIDNHLARMAEVRGSSLESLKAFRGMLVGSLIQGGYGTTEWAIRQAYIALGNFMTAAALLGVDTCPMEGFVPAEYDKILGLEARGLTASVCCAAGYRSETDKYAGLAKVRFAARNVVEHI